MTSRARKSRKSKKPAAKRRSSKRRGAQQRRSVSGTVGVFAGVVFLAAVGVGVVHEEAGVEPEPAAAVVWDGGRVRVEVQNGGGVTGMARAATERLRPVGFDVVKFGNASSFDPDRPSVVVDRIGRIDQAEAVAKALGIDNVLSEPDPNLYVDVTVVLGQEWDPAIRSHQSQVNSKLPWWDPRDWFGS